MNLVVNVILPIHSTPLPRFPYSLTASCQKVCQLARDIILSGKPSQVQNSISYSRRIFHRCSKACSTSGANAGRIQLNMQKYAVCVLFVTSILYLTGCEAQSYDDKRCKCICPSISSVINTTQPSPDRLNFISNVPPDNCNCEGVILPKIKGQLKGQEQIFCPRCECKYENRNTAIIKFVVIIVIWVISLLVIYMLFLICLDPLLNKRVHKAAGNGGYLEHTNEEDDASVAPGTSHPMGVRGNVLNRVGHQQDKWKRQVREQRRNIYDRHTMLN